MGIFSKTNWVTRFVAVAGLFAGGCHQNGGHADLNEVVMDWDNALVDVGRGVDSVTETVKGKCLSFADADFGEPLGGNRKTTSWDVRLVTDRLAFERFLSVSASASLRAGFGSQGVSVKAKYMESKKTNDYNVYAVVMVTHDAGKKILRSADLAPAAVTMLENDRDEEFRRRCGDEYFSAVRYGGEFFAVLEFRTTTDELRKEIEAQIKAHSNSGLFSGSGSASFHDALKKVTEHTEVSISGYQIGGKIAQVTEQMSVDGLLTAADLFIATIQAEDMINAAPYETISEPYISLLSYPEGANPVDRQNKREILQDLNFTRGALRRDLDNVDFVLQYASQFEAFDAATLQGLRSTLVSSLNTVYKSASACFDDVSECQRPDIVRPAMNLPNRKPASVTNRHPICGVERYNMDVGPVCGQPTYPIMRTAACGVETYLIGRTAACGIESYKMARTNHCPVETYRARADMSCPGSVTEHIYEYTIDGAKDPAPCRAGDLQIDFIVREGSRHVGRGGDGDSYRYIRSQTRVCKRQEKPAVCRKPAFGPQTYTRCRHKTHGVDTYKSCRAAGHGIELYKLCSSPANGAPQYPKCEHASFGVALYKECAHPQE